MYKWSKMSIGILGAGIENISLVNYLLENNAKVIVYDKADPRLVSEKMKDLENPNLMIVSGKDYRRKLSNHDIFFRSPGMPLSLAKRITRGKGLLSSAMELFFELSPAKIIGVTGTKGKGTTSALIAEILKQKNKNNVFLLGNIGKAQFDVIDEITKDDLVVMEMSSFQLEDMTKSPDIAVVLNITPDHLAPLSKNNPNFHKNFKVYVKSKRKIVENQTKENFAVIGLNDELFKDFTAKINSAIFTIGKLGQGCYLKDGTFWIDIDGSKMEIAHENLFQIKGKHHLINAQAAIMASYLAGADVESIQAGLRSFKGLPHRFQFVKQINGVNYIDDSFATDIDAAIAAIKAATGDLVIILGGSSKGADFSSLANAISEKNVRALIVIGDETEKIIDAIKLAGVEVEIISGLTTMKEIVSKAHEIAKPGDTVLLSPACASFGLFLSASDRGDQFCEFVKSIN